MARLYGRMQGNRGQVTRCGSDHLRTQAETWGGKVQVDLRGDGSFTVTVGPKGWGGRVVLEGNLDAEGQPVKYVEPETV